MRGREERSPGVTPDRGIGEFLSRVAQRMFCRAGVAGRNRPARRGSGRRAVCGCSEGKAFPRETQVIGLCLATFVDGAEKAK